MVLVHENFQEFLCLAQDDHFQSFINKLGYNRIGMPDWRMSN